MATALSAAVCEATAWETEAWPAFESSPEEAIGVSSVVEVTSATSVAVSVEQLTPPEWSLPPGGVSAKFVLVQSI